MSRSLLCLLFFMLSLASFTSAQDRNPYRFSREETGEILLDKSKKDKTKAFIALGGGLALSGLGIHFLHKDPYTLTGNVSGTTTVSESDNHILGTCLLAGGITSILSSPFLFIRAGRFKHKAKLLMSDEPASFLNKTLSVPSIALQVSF